MYEAKLLPLCVTADTFGSTLRNESSISMNADDSRILRAFRPSFNQFKTMKYSTGLGS